MSSQFQKRDIITDHQTFPQRENIPSFPEIKSEEVTSYDLYLSVMEEIRRTSSEPTVLPEELLKELSSKRSFAILKKMGVNIEKTLQRVTVSNTIDDSDEESGEREPEVSEDEASERFDNGDDDDDFNEASEKDEEAFY